MEEAQELCDRVAIMDHGKIIALDTPDALIAATGLESTVEIGSPKESFCEAVEKANLPVRISRTPGKLVLHTSEPSKVLKEVTGIAAQLDLTLDDLSVHKSTLEDVFLALTGHQLRE
jgi:ABC-2 type transport system ATP-binding protein